MTRNHVQVRENIQYSFNANHRDTMAALARAKFTPREHQVIVALLNETDGRLREDCELTSASWQALTFLSRQSVNTAVRHLVSLNVIAAEGRRYRLTRPNVWAPDVFRPAHMARQAVQVAQDALAKEKEKESYAWFRRTIKASLSRDAQKASPSRDGVSQQRRKRLPAETVSSPSGDAFGGGHRRGEEEKRHTVPSEEGTARRKRRGTPDPRVKEILEAMGKEYGYPDKTGIDPIPNYGQEGTAIKRMLNRGFTPVDILSAWRGKIGKRREFVSMVWVNHDIGKEAQREQSISRPGGRPAPDKAGDDFFKGLPDTSFRRE